MSGKSLMCGDNKVKGHRKVVIGTHTIDLLKVHWSKTAFSNGLIHFKGSLTMIYEGLMQKR